MGGTGNQTAADAMPYIFPVPLPTRDHLGSAFAPPPPAWSVAHIREEYTVQLRKASRLQTALLYVLY